MASRNTENRSCGIIFRKRKPWCQVKIAEYLESIGILLGVGNVRRAEVKTAEYLEIRDLLPGVGKAGGTLGAWSPRASGVRMTVKDRSMPAF
ncbi:hypothetical protein GCM10027291_13990 [Telluribacter humicola]